MIAWKMGREVEEAWQQFCYKFAKFNGPVDRVHSDRNLCGPSKLDKVLRWIVVPSDTYRFYRGTNRELR
jgi:hypothetical protein